jgi:hypothetical protein
MPMAYDPGQFSSTPLEYATKEQLASAQALAQMLTQPEQQKMYKPIEGVSQVLKALIGGYFEHQNAQKQLAMAQQGRELNTASLPSVGGGAPQPEQSPQRTAALGGTATDAGSAPAPSGPPPFASSVANAVSPSVGASGVSPTGGPQASGVTGMTASAGSPLIQSQIAALTGGNPAAPSAPVQTAQASGGAPAASDASLLPRPGQYIDPHLLQQRMPVTKEQVGHAYMMATLGHIPWDQYNTLRQAYMDQLQPRSMPTAGGTIITDASGQHQAFNPSLEKNEVSSGSSKMTNYEVLDPRTGTIRTIPRAPIGGTAPSGQPATQSGQASGQITQPQTLQDLQQMDVQHEAQKAAAIESAKSGPAAQAEYAKGEAQDFQKKMAGYRVAADSARTNLPNIEQAQRILNDPRFISGQGSDIIGRLNSYAQTAGLSKGETSTLQQVFTKTASKQNLGEIKDLASGGGVGPIRVAEMNLINNAGTTLENNPNANKVIAFLQKKMADRVIEREGMANAYADAHGGQIDRGFDKQLNDYYAKNPLLSGQDLNYTNGLLGIKPVSISTKADYDSLPSDAEYIDARDGQKKRKR